MKDLNASADEDRNRTVSVGGHKNQDEIQSKMFERTVKYPLYDESKKRSKTPGEGAQKRFFNIR